MVSKVSSFVHAPRPESSERGGDQANKVTAGLS